VIHRLYYEGELMGEVPNPLNSFNHAWLCLNCGRRFAERISPQPEGWRFWEVYCAKHINTDGKMDNLHSVVADFHRGGDATNLASLKAQFLYELEARYGS
jgi:hypothetical protein